jgi:hypothetical protein
MELLMSVPHVVTIPVRKLRPNKRNARTHSKKQIRQIANSIRRRLDGDAPARAVIEEQDRLIAEKSGQPAVAVKSIRRSGAK